VARRFALVLALVALVASVLIAATPASAGLLNPACKPADAWPTFGHDNTRSFATDEDCLYRTNAIALRPKWFFNTNSAITSQPAVVGGVVYAGTYDGHFYAVRASNGKAVWTHPFDIRPFDKDEVDFGEMPGSPSVTTIGGRRVVIFPAGATVFALDALTGARLSSICLDRVATTCQGGTGYATEDEGSPLIIPAADGQSARVIVGTDTNEDSPSGPAGLISLDFDLTHGFTTRWWFDPEAGQTYPGLAPTQVKGHEKGNGCSDVWASPTIDPSTNVVVFGTRNCTHPDRVQRAPGVTLPVLAESVMAVDLTTGAFRWQYAPRTPKQGYNLDYDFGATPNLLAPGVVGEGGKDGTYYVVNSGTGALLWKTTVAVGSEIGGLIASTAVGRFSDNGHMAIFTDSAIPLSSNNPQGSLKTIVGHPQYAFAVHAIDAVTHKIRWAGPFLPAFAAPIFAGGLVLVPDTIGGALLVLDATTGLVLHAEPLNSVPAGPPVIVGHSVYVGAGIGENIPGIGPVAKLGGLWALTTSL
jgi:polyvinyl alcohol dehydrogenase (cytochrome)